MKSEDLQSSYEFGPYHLEVERRRLWRGEEVVQLRPKAIATLLLLIKHRDRILTKEELLGQLWPSTVVEEANLTQYIYLLRKTLDEGIGENGNPQDYILTVPGCGYRFIGSVKEVQAEQTNLIKPEQGQVSPGIEEETTEQTIQRASINGLGDRLNTSKSFNAVETKQWVSVAVSLAVLSLMITVVVYLIRGNNNSAAAVAWSMTRLTNTGNVPLATISPDGSLISYVIADSGQQSIWIRQSSNSNEVQIVPRAEVYYGGLTFSPDASQIYYVVRGKGESAYSLFQIPAIGGTTKKLKMGLDSPISFSPDGSQFTFVRESAAQGKSSLMIASSDGSAERELAARPLPEIFDYPAWSPDGKVIACTFVNPATKQHVSVVEVRVADGVSMPLSSRSWAYALTPQWMDDGRSLVITALEGAKQSIWQLPYPRGEARRLTNDLTSYLRLSLASKAQSIVTVESSELTNLWVVPLADIRRAKPFFSGIGRYGQPAWMPDGRIVYASEANGSWDIWVMDADGSGHQQLTNDANGDTDPAVSPDGRFIVFTSDQMGNSKIWRMDANGANRRRLTSGGNDINPKCTPDGKWVVYNSFSSAKPFALYKVPIIGGETVLLTNSPCRKPAISPDGKLIACLYSGESVSAQVEPTAIAVLPAEGGVLKKVGDFLSSTIVADRTQLGWTPDGRAITYVDNRGGHANLWAQPLDGGPVKQLTDFHDGQLFAFDWSRDGRQLVCLRGILRQDAVLIRNFR